MDAQKMSSQKMDPKLSEGVAGAVESMAEEGASLEGDTASSVELAAVAAIDLASRDMSDAIGNARVIALRFDDNGDVRVSALSDAQASAAESMLAAEGVASKVVSMADLKVAIDEASEGEDEGDDMPEASDSSGVM